MVTDEEIEEAVPAYTAPPVAPQAVASVSAEDFSGATKQQTAQVLDQDLFKAFSVGNVTIVQTTEDHKPPLYDDTIEGRYAGVLFSTASQQEALYTIYEDISYIKGLYDASDSFK